MKLRTRQTAGLILAALTLGLALTGLDALIGTHETAGKIIGLIAVTCLVLLAELSGPGRHRKGGN